MKKIVRVSTNLLAILAVGFTLSCNDESGISTDKNLEATASVNDASTSSRIGGKFHSQVGAPIEKEKAQKWMQNFSNKKIGDMKGLKSHFFGKETFERLLNQDKLAGISLFYALNDEGIPQILLVGVDEDGNLMTNEGQQGYYDMSTICPPVCN